MSRAISKRITAIILAAGLVIGNISAVYAEPLSDNSGITEPGDTNPGQDGEGKGNGNAGTSGSETTENKPEDEPGPVNETKKTVLNTNITPVDPPSADEDDTPSQINGDDTDVPLEGNGESDPTDDEEITKDPFLSSGSDMYQWHHAAIDHDFNDNQGKGVKVAVIDTGVNEHEDLDGQVIDKTSMITETEDKECHGSIQAGIIAAKYNNGKGGAGIAPNASIISIKTSHTNSDIQQLDDGLLIKAIDYAIKSGAKVINISQHAKAGSYVNPDVQKKINEATEKGITIIAAVGNNTSSELYYPAAYENVIAVAAYNQDGKLASNSNYGNWVEVAAPGVDIYSTIKGDSYAGWSGSSEATSVVSGIAAVLYSENGSLTAEQVRKCIIEGAKQGGKKIGDYYSVNLAKSIELAKGMKTETDSNSETSDEDEENEESQNNPENQKNPEDPENQKNPENLENKENQENTEPSKNLENPENPENQDENPGDNTPEDEKDIEAKVKLSTPEQGEGYTIDKTKGTVRADNGFEIKIDGMTDWTDNEVAFESKAKCEIRRKAKNDDQISSDSYEFVLPAKYDVVLPKRLAGVYEVQGDASVIVEGGDISFNVSFYDGVIGSVKNNGMTLAGNNGEYAIKDVSDKTVITIDDLRYVVSDYRPEYVGRTIDSITIRGVEGYEYVISESRNIGDDDALWNNSKKSNNEITFKDLKKNTTYYVFARKQARTMDETHIAASNIVATNAIKTMAVAETPAPETGYYIDKQAGTIIANDGYEIKVGDKGEWTNKAVIFDSEEMCLIRRKAEGDDQIDSDPLEFKLPAKYTVKLPSSVEGKYIVEGKNTTVVSGGYAEFAVRYAGDDIIGEVRNGDSVLSPGTDGYTYKIDNVTSNISVTVEAKIKLPVPESNTGYTIDKDKGTIKADTGYEIKIDGMTDWTEEEMVFSSRATGLIRRKTQDDEHVSSDTLEFILPAKYTVYLPDSVAGKYTVEGEGVTVVDGGSVSFEIRFAGEDIIGRVRIGDEVLSPNSDGYTYVINNVTNDVQVSVDALPGTKVPSNVTAGTYTVYVGDSVKGQEYIVVKAGNLDVGKIDYDDLWNTSGIVKYDGNGGNLELRRTYDGSDIVHSEQGNRAEYFVVTRVKDISTAGLLGVESARSSVVATLYEEYVKEAQGANGNIEVTEQDSNGNIIAKAYAVKTEVNDETLPIVRPVINYDILKQIPGITWTGTVDVSFKKGAPSKESLEKAKQTIQNDANLSTYIKKDEQVEYMDLSLKVGGKEIHELNPIIIEISIPDKFSNVPVASGYKRNYILIRVHEQEEGTEVKGLLPTNITEKTLTFVTDRFSTYAIAYEDILIPTISATSSSGGSSSSSHHSSKSSGSSNGSSGSGASSATVATASAPAMTFVNIPELVTAGAGQSESGESDVKTSKSVKSKSSEDSNIEEVVADADASDEDVNDEEESVYSSEAIKADNGDISQVASALGNTADVAVTQGEALVDVSSNKGERSFIPFVLLAVVAMLAIGAAAVFIPWKRKEL